MHTIFIFLLSIALWANGVSAQSRMARQLEAIGFIDIAKADSSIAIDLRYTRADNFTGKVLYTELKEAYLHPLAMESLKRAQQILKREYPQYSLMVWDATRPLDVQQEMWDLVKGTPQHIYVSNPANGGGLHNYGLAVDVTILGADGKPLSMGTPFDHFGKEAHITHEEELVKEGKITAQERANRLLLRRVMREAGFRTLNSEWWHFNRVSRKEAHKNFKVVRTDLAEDDD